MLSKNNKYTTDYRLLSSVIFDFKYFYNSINFTTKHKQNYLITKLALKNYKKLKNCCQRYFMIPHRLFSCCLLSYPLSSVLYGSSFFQPLLEGLQLRHQHLYLHIIWLYHLGADMALWISALGLSLSSLKNKAVVKSASFEFCK